MFTGSSTNIYDLIQVLVFYLLFNCPSVVFVDMCIGEYPDRYRPLIWRFLLRLPENASAFSELGNVP